MVSTVTSVIGFIAALTIIVLIRRDHLHVRYGLWWIAVAGAFILFGFYPAPVLDVSATSVEALIKGFNASLAAAEQARLAFVP